MFKILTLVYIVCVLHTETARILAVYPSPSISHQVVFHALSKELVRRGHEVIVITPNPEFPKGQAPVNLTEIDVHDISYNFCYEFMMYMKPKYEIGVKSNRKTFIENLDFFFTVVERQIKSKEVQNLIRSNSSFDLLLIEPFIRPALIYSHIFKAPIIHVSSFGATLENFEVIGAPTHFTLYPRTYSQRLHNLSFWDKIQEYYYSLFEMYKRYKGIAEENKMIQRILGQNSPSIKDLEKNVEMLFLNYHPMWMNNMPLPPGVVFMGGLPQKPKKELPKDLKSYLDSSKNGVVYVSFGTNVHPVTFPSGRLKVLVESLSELPYDILFKWNDDVLPGRTENIKISKWLPQSDLLRHPKLRAFLTQGGLQSTDEAISAGVPLVCIPMLGDQWYNAEQYEHFKIGIQLDFLSFTKLQLQNAIETVIQNKSYRENIVKLRELMNDQPQKPLERAMWWIEYVLRHGTARHLRAPAANISWAQYYELELVFVVLTAVLTILIILSYLAVSVWSIVYRFLRFNTKVKRS